MRYSKKVFIAIIFTFILCLDVNGQSSTSVVDFYSPSLEEEREMIVYLPEGYNELNDSSFYPVIFFLHGATPNYRLYDPAFPAFESLMKSGDLRESIVVMPDATFDPFSGSFYTNSEASGQFEDYIYEDVISYIDSTYRSLASKEARCIMGHSMGGFGAIKIAAKYPELFNCVASHNGPLDFNKGLGGIIDQIRIEAGGNAPFSFLIDNGRFTKLGLSIAIALSPNVNNSPYQTDFIIDENGEVVDSVRKVWLKESPGNLIRSITSEDDLDIYFDSGTQDELLVHPFNTGFADTLNKYEIEFESDYYNGDHSSTLVFRLENSAKFIESSFSTAVSNENERSNVVEFILSQNYPNPFNPSTNISFELPEAGLVQLKVFNMLGQEVASLVDGRMNSGNHSVNFDASQLSSGVYIYRLMAGSQSITKKMMLIK